jgi:hypothetical protein
MRKLIGLAVGALLVIAGNVSIVDAEWGDGGDSTVQVGPVSNGPVVSQGSAGYDPNGITATATTKPTGSSPTSTAPTYIYRPATGNSVPGSCWSQSNSAALSNPCGGIPVSACPPNQTGYYVYDSGGNSLGLVCVPNPTDNLLPPMTPDIALADEASSRQPWPNLILRANPGTGMTGLASWFWLAGSATMGDAVASSGPLTVRVHARLVGATWEFGDGFGLDTSDLGQAYPAVSDIQHTYQADAYGMAVGYTVIADLHFLVTYSVNGGRWLTLGVKTKAYFELYNVEQLQPEAVSSP